ncbi:A circularly permuted ATPgrasp-domain-containing protein, partial [Russula earlei]
MSSAAIWQQYTTQSGIWDEMSNGTQIREQYQKVFETLEHLSIDTLQQKDRLASELFMNQGITFTVYSDNKGIERIFPFDIIPRIITSAEWDHVEKGIQQRLKALNLFLKDVYNDQQIIKDKVIPATLIASCAHYTREVFGIKVPYDIYVHISGIDLIRSEDGTFYVLEDNLRTPSGVSYMLENREVTKRIFSDMLYANKVRMLAPTQLSDPNVVLLTPGIYNSAYYEHTFLARQMGIDLVQGRDLVIDNHKVYTKTINGLKQVHVIYRRIDDEYLDPLAFKSDSVLGVPGLLGVYRKGNVTIVNAVGNGVADDKAVYNYVPAMIKYYLNEEPILPNVPTYELSDPEARKHVFDNIDNMVIKRTNQSGGYGMLMGNKAEEKEIDTFKKAVEEDPRSFIAQPIIKLSTVPCFIDGKFVARHVDLRPYALCGPEELQILYFGSIVIWTILPKKYGNRIHHITKYEYDRPIKESSNEVKIFPYLCNEQEVLQHELLITNNPEVQ